MNTNLYFDGATYEPEHDQKRLTGQLGRVYAMLQDGQWHTLKYLAYMVDASEAGTSARLRDLRKEKFGGHVIERRRVIGGLYEYRLGRKS